MNELSRGLKSAIFLAILAIYVSVFWVSFGRAIPTGATLTPLLSDLGPNGTPGNRSDPGGSINTISINAVQQNPGWKAYFGNITGALVLKNTGGQSIYEWTLVASSLSGNIFVTRSAAVNWTPIRCANQSEIDAEDVALGFTPGVSDTINKTFNYTTHKAMSVSGVGTINNNTCNSTATYVNGSAQAMSSSTKFQEILLSDTSSLIYGTFIDQDSWGFNNNTGNTVDFQVLIADPKNATSFTYYFYADIS